MSEPLFSPPPGGADLAISAGRRRRHRHQLGGVAGAAAAAAVAVVVALHPFGTSGGGHDSLRIAGDPTAGADATASPAPSSSAEPTPASGEDATPQPQPSAGQSGAPADDRGGDGPDESAGESPAPAAGEEPERVSPPPSRSVVAYSNDPACADTLAVPSTGPTWCAFYSGDTSARRGGSATVSVDFCRMPGTGSGTWEFSDEDGVSIDVSDGRTVQWSSQDGREVAQRPFRITLDAGTCMRFSTSWDTRDRDGFRVRPGDYDVGFGYSGNALGGSGSTASSGDTITVTS